MKTIKCPDCHEEKPLSEYHKDLSAPNKVSWYCKPCKRKRTNAYREKNREHYNAVNRKNYHMRKNRRNRDEQRA